MGEKMNKNKVGLIVGLFFAIVHAVWALIVAVAPKSLQAFLDWIFNIHFLEPIWVITAFNLVNAMLLVVITFICGFIFGWVFAGIHNWFSRKK